MRQRHRLALAGLVLAAAWIGATAAEKVITLKNGRQLVGEVTETRNGYEIRKPGGVLIVIGKDDVEKIEDVQTQENEYQQRLKATDPKDPEKLYQLARWAADKDLLVEARGLLDKVLKLKPGDENARLLLRLVDIRLKAATRPSTSGPSTRQGTDVRIPPSQLLSQEDVYRIRLLELQRGDRVRIEYRDRALDRFIEQMRGTGDFAKAGGERRFRTAPRIDQVRYILENTDRASPLRDDILIKTDPSVMSQFRTRVWQIIASGCATSQCHGGLKGEGGLRLLTAPTSQDRVVYTNFYVLTDWSLGGRKLMKRDNPEMSLLLQYGLPPDLARLPHPVRITPVFRNPDDRNYRLVLEWIKSLRHPVPGGARPYGIKYEIPGQPKTTTTPSIFD